MWTSPSAKFRANSAGGSHVDNGVLTGLGCSLVKSSQGRSLSHLAFIPRSWYPSGQFTPHCQPSPQVTVNIIMAENHRLTVSFVSEECWCKLLWYVTAFVTPRLAALSRFKCSVKIACLIYRCIVHDTTAEDKLVLLLQLIPSGEYFHSIFKTPLVSNTLSANVNKIITKRLLKISIF